MKRKLLILSVLAICLATYAAGTLAYFSVESTAHNVITSGGVDITLDEWANEDKTEVYNKKQTGIMPGAKVTKIVEVKNTGESDAWVRVKVKKAISLKGNDTPDLSLINVNCNDTDWTYKDGFFYYNKPLKPGEVTEPVFTKVTFDKTMGNMYQNSTAAVSVYAQAVQYANNGDDVFEAKGWPADSSEDIDWAGTVDDPKPGRPTDAKPAPDKPLTPSVSESEVVEPAEPAAPTEPVEPVAPVEPEL